MQTKAQDYHCEQVRSGEAPFGIRLRDQLVTRTLRSRGWQVLRIWEHDLSRNSISRLQSRISRALGK